jgi:hypothetical protein
VSGRILPHARGGRARGGGGRGPDAPTSPRGGRRRGNGITDAAQADLRAALSHIQDLNISFEW